MALLHMFGLILVAVCQAAEFNFSVDVRPNSSSSISSGHYVLNAVMSIPDMFVRDNTRRRLHEDPVTTSNKQPTLPPTNKITLPVIFLIPPEGAQDKSLSIYGSKFDMDVSLKAALFDQLTDKLVYDGKMAVIRYDKRNCHTPSSLQSPATFNRSQYSGPQPICEDSCPSWCPSMINSCNVVQECYNNTNLTILDLKTDAKRVYKSGLQSIRQYLDPDIVDLNRMWSVPLGYSAQGASIAAYLASSVDTKASLQSQSQSTAISLLGSSLQIDELLIYQLRSKLNALNHSNENVTNLAVMQLANTFEAIRNGSLSPRDMVYIDNDFLDASEMKHVKYWKDWLDLNDDIRYDALSNFLAINSFTDEQIPYDAFKDFYALLPANITAETYVARDINHYMINVQDWQDGKWQIDEKISEQIITFLNDVSGYLDHTQRWIVLNNSNRSSEEHVLVENSTVYKVLLYVAIMSIIMILAVGIYCVAASKVCPYEFEDVDITQAEQEVQRERERERRRRHRRRRSHHHHHHNHHRHRNSRSVSEAVAIQSAVSPEDAASHDQHRRHRNHRRRHHENNSLTERLIEMNEPAVQLNQHIVHESAQQHVHANGNDNDNENENETENGNVLEDQEHNEVL